MSVKFAGKMKGLSLAVWVSKNKKIKLEGLF